MKKLFEKWWDRETKCFSIRNYKQPWREVGNKPRLDFWTNGAKKGKDRHLDVTLTVGYTIFNYTNFDYLKTPKWRICLDNIKRWWSRERCYKKMEYNNKAAMGLCAGLDGKSEMLIKLGWDVCSDCVHFIGYKCQKKEDKKMMYCPDCEKEFGFEDLVIIRGGIVRCPNCEVELKTILFGFNTDQIIIDDPLKGEGK